TPPFLRVLPLRIEQRPQAGRIDHHAVVEIRLVTGVLLARRALRVCGWRTPIGALLKVLDKLLQLLARVQEVAIRLFGCSRSFLVRAVAYRSKIGETAVEPLAREIEMISQQHTQRATCKAVDVYPRDERSMFRRERPMNRPVLVHALVHILEEVKRQ